MPDARGDAVPGFDTGAASGGSAVTPAPRPSAAPRAAPADGARTTPVVLVAEDETAVREMVALVLRTHGYQPVLCEDGAIAQAVLDGDRHLDAALLDIRMPHVDGVTVVRYIRAHPRRAALPVIAMSAYNDDFQAREVRAAGADAFLAKPFTVQDLTATLDRLLAAAGSPASG